MSNIHCQYCSTKYDELEIRENLVNTKVQTAIFQCQQCLCIGQPIRIYEEKNCAVCLDGIEPKRVFKCGHWVCSHCYESENFVKEKCPICLEISDAKLVQNSKCDFFDDDLKIKSYMKTLAIVVYDKVIGFISPNNSLYNLLVEYYKFVNLLRINDNNNNQMKLSPPDVIDMVWHEHILDLKNYVDFCQIINAGLLYHYPENGFACDYENRIKRFKYTKELYLSTYDVLESAEFWTLYSFDEQLLYLAIGFVDVIIFTTKKVLKIPFHHNMTVLDMKGIISKLIDMTPCSQRLIWAGHNLADEQLLSEVNVEVGSKIYLLSRLRGC